MFEGSKHVGTRGQVRPPASLWKDMFHILKVNNNHCPRCHQLKLLQVNPLPGQSGDQTPSTTAASWRT
eukprot:3470431-Prorocentrum_lima.AAC.1